VKVRTRLVLAFAYVLITVIVALTIPLAVTLRSRATTENLSQALSNAQTLAASIGMAGLAENVRTQLITEVDRAAANIPGGHIVVVDKDGFVLADSDGERPPTQNLKNGLRLEFERALACPGPTPYRGIRPSDTLGEDLLVAAAPIIDDRSTCAVGAVRVSQDIGQVQSNVNRVTIGVIIIGLTGLLAGLVIAFAMAGSFARPLHRLAATARELGSGDLQARAGDVKGASEIDDLARSFDEMADRLERTVQAQREFVANASHQLRTPLTGMKLRLEAAAAQSDDPDVKRQLQAADTEVDRLAETVNRLLVMAREVEAGSAPTVPVTDLREAAARAAERWSERAGRLASTVRLDARTEAPARIDATDLDQMLDNLLDNAIAYAPGVVELEAAPTFVAVRDHGPGIPEDERGRVTERFYRGRGAPSGGSGLGLAIVRDLAERWGGSVRIESPPEGGTRIQVTLTSDGTRP
jgi:signal transduction histidine kinase